MGLAAGEDTLLGRAKAHIGKKYKKPGNVYLGVVSRLDVPVSGIVLFARTSKAAARLNEQFRTRSVEKTYLALVEGMMDPPEGECVDRIREDERHRKVWLTREPEGKEARLRYETLFRTKERSLLTIRLDTGRKHQIRVQLSGRGFPILGDLKYGARSTFPKGIALHAFRLAVNHPTTNVRMEWTAPPPPDWKRYGVATHEIAVHGAKNGNDD